MNPIKLDLKVKYSLAWLITAFSLLLCVGVLLTPMGACLKSLLCSLLIGAGLYALALHAFLLLPHSVIQVLIDEKGHCWLTRKNQQRFQIKIKRDSVAHVWCTALYYSMHPFCNGVVLITPDGVDAEAFRKLRVWLLMSRDGTQ